MRDEAFGIMMGPSILLLAALTCHAALGSDEPADSRTIREILDIIENESAYHGKMVGRGGQNRAGMRLELLVCIE